MKIKIIAEIGLNHFGKIEIIKDYLARVRNKDIDGVSIQILNKKKTLKKFKKFALKKSDIKKFLTIAKKDFNNVGIAIHSWDDFKFIKSLKPDFIKILGSSFGNTKYYNQVKTTKPKRIFLSTGGRSIAEISNFLGKIDKKKLNLLFTFFKTKNFLKEIKKIQVLKKKFKLNVAFGNHYNNVNYIPKVCFYKPSEIFFYIKMKKKRNYPDDKHAVSIKNLSQLIKKIKKYD